MPITTGSSPRMRGTLEHWCGSVRNHRFIPAYAGNTILCRPSSIAGTVHPRVCGEHDFEGVLSHDAIGSSPRMRGTRGRRVLRLQRYRFIPAYAGNTRTLVRQCSESPVHPRVCGEHDLMPAFFNRGNGSSPRMRGTLQPEPMRRAAFRFIPAYAGNTIQPTVQLSL